MSIASHPVIDTAGSTSATLYFETASDILVAEFSEKYLFKNHEAYSKLSTTEEEAAIAED